MAARAMWKGVIRFAEVEVPVKLYSAVQDRSVHFRLLHAKDRSPVKQAMVNPDTDEVVPHAETRRAYRTDEGSLVVFDKQELEALEPDSGRDIEVIRFMPPQAIDHRWYDRPYYLGPDGSESLYFALAEALANSGKEGLARWVMRKKSYVGALRLHRGVPMLMSLRHEEQVVPVDALEPPKGKALDAKELDMARQLIGMLEAEFDPDEYHDEYRERVLELIEAKRRGKSVKVTPIRRREASDDLSKALEASLKKERKRA
ncbi:non-homologous end joining protein Ku [Billgrantia desiderata]|uniref:Non-homologous end joining protein Ku n=1 Tax=Billgrantia desiderata TaxID=52021 RepID=A0AAW4YP92_9GAMM|nr:Ku protein [Halomonas desiderata]MCE8013598.1 Ku protein [Halomonas desiderata]MCE8050224.1 Ku protein [Halomonas desiderata]OUE45689.1 Ku protein [Halomonas desiderata SP1]SEF77235.1 DNA end-binding protein Ku [Halomonas desiderata]